MAMMAGKIIIDTNIVSYLRNQVPMVTQAWAQHIKQFQEDGVTICVTNQVVGEFLVTQTNLQKIAKQLDYNKLHEETDNILAHFLVVYPTQQSVSNLVSLTKKYQLQGKKYMMPIL